MRRALTGVINPGTVRSLREPFTLPAVEIVGELAKLDGFDIVTQLAEKYPIRVFPDAVGLPEEGREHLLPYGNMVFNAFGPENYVYQQACANGDEHSAGGMKLCARESLDDVGLGSKICDRVKVGLISEEPAALLVRALLSAAVDTTTS